MNSNERKRNEDREYKKSILDIESFSSKCVLNKYFSPDTSSGIFQYLCIKYQ